VELVQAAATQPSTALPKGKSKDAKKAEQEADRKAKEGTKKGKEDAKKGDDASGWVPLWLLQVLSLQCFSHKEQHC
jgi:hypothetical protein